jgi:predicted nuclease with TOPRIM domain
MSNEEFERKMAFIVEQQAQFAADIQRMETVQGHIQTTQLQTENVVGRLAYATLEGFRDVNTKIDELVDSQIKLTESQTQTDQNLRDVNTKIDALVDSQIKLTESQTQTDQNLRDVNTKMDALVDSQIKLTESQTQTDHTLRNLIAVVDRYFTKGRNGK